MHLELIFALNPRDFLMQRGETAPLGNWMPPLALELALCVRDPSPIPAIRALGAGSHRFADGFVCVNGSSSVSLDGLWGFVLIPLV